uniref:NADH:quinone oxidoreductase/Mrp antiporter transmembrane domain-containing protein n=1 Tax=Caldilinea aerophila TaxID=133453 RepID=A0A7C1JQ33_9CHLR
MNPVEPFGIPLISLLFVFFIGAASISFLLRTWVRLVALAGASAAVLLAVWIWSLDLSLPIWILPFGINVDLEAPLVLSSYSLQLRVSNTPVLASYLLLAALALALNALHAHDILFSTQVWMLLTGYSALTLLTNAPAAPIVIAPVLFIMLTALSVYVLHGGRQGNLNAGVRLLIPPVLATPLLLVGGWWLEQIPLNPQDLVFTQTAGTLIGLGFLVLLTPFPLHGAWSASSKSSSPAAALIVGLFYQLGVLYLAAQALNLYPFIFRQTDWPVWMSALGLLTAIWGGVAAMGTTHAGRLWGYAAIHDWGLILLAMAAPELRSWTLVLFLFALRVISMITSAIGLIALERQVGSLEMQRLRGVGLRMPWSSAAVLLGGLGLVGFPLTAGFAGHWAALQSLAVLDWRLATAILIAAVGAILGFVRLARLMFGVQDAPLTVRESALNIGTALGALILTLIVATSPQLLSAILTRILTAFG